MIREPNVLVLDEPTNHLDLESIDALVKGLRDYPGTLVFVSHDRWFVERLANRIVEIGEDGIRDYRGTYAEYVAFCGDDHLDVAAVTLRAGRVPARNGGNARDGGDGPRGRRGPPTGSASSRRAGRSWLRGSRPRRRGLPRSRGCSRRRRSIARPARRRCRRWKASAVG